MSVNEDQIDVMLLLTERSCATSDHRLPAQQ